MLAATLAAALSVTPIEPTPHDPHTPAFRLYAEIDIPVLAMAGVFASARFFRTQPAYCAPRCDPGDLNKFDRLTAGYWSPGWARASDVGLAVLAVGSATVLVADEGWLPALNDAVVIAQSALLATAAPSMLTIASGRPRPFLYGDRAPEDVRKSSDAGMSYISSHTSIAFALATSTFMAVHRRHPSRSWWVLAVGLPIASTVGVARVMAGRHFMTDVMGGAVVGAAMGVLVPALHEAPVRVVPAIDKTGGTVTIEGVL